MKLLVTTPTSVVLDAANVRHVRAEDETGAFGILPGHADFITVLAISVVTWRNDANEEHHVAVRGGVLTISDGRLIEIATRDAVGEDTLKTLGQSVLARFRDEAKAEEESQISATRLHLAAIRQLQRYLEAGRRPVPQGPPPSLGVSTAQGGPPGEGELE
ncbi:MAG: F0F1 ATP synthase subunit epsilon [Alphaproteobacteria bacterium]